MKQSARMRDAVHPLSPIPVVICRMCPSAISLPREAKSTAFGIARSALLCNNIDIKYASRPIRERFLPSDFSISNVTMLLYLTGCPHGGAFDVKPGSNSAHVHRFYNCLP